MEITFNKLEQLWISVILLCNFVKAENVNRKAVSLKDMQTSYNVPLYSDVSIHKVTLTQKGYIQFLRYITDVPTLTDFTFCIWIRSHNLTYSHPLLSYSKHEEERLIRAWISPNGAEINLALMEYKIFRVPVRLKENHWYHICQSWDSGLATWYLYLNGKLKASGQEMKFQGLNIPGKGDIVVGQEYTDFDKGLDDGIEGDIYGFNLVLSPTTSITTYRPWQATQHRPTPDDHPSLNELEAGLHQYQQQQQQPYYQQHNKLPQDSDVFQDNRRHLVLAGGSYLADLRQHDALNMYGNPSTVRNAILNEFPYKYQVHRDISSVTQVPYLDRNSPILETTPELDISHVLGYFKLGAASRTPKGFMDFTQHLMRNVFTIFQPPNNDPKLRQKNANLEQRVSNGYTNLAPGGAGITYGSFTTVPQHHQQRLSSGGVSNGGKVTPMPAYRRDFKTKYSYGVGRSLGLALVELSYGNCALGKGTPVTDDDRLLVSWTKTPVRVFGGAILRSEPPFCTRS